MRRERLVALLAVLALPPPGRGHADAEAVATPSPRVLARIASGVPADEPALRWAEHAEAVCARNPRAGACAIVEPALELAALRVALAEAEAGARALGLEVAPTQAAPPSREAEAARIASDAAALRTRLAAIEAAFGRAAQPTPAEAPLELARAMASEAAARAASDDDAYRSRRGRREPTSASLHRPAIAELEASLRTRIERLADDARARHARDEFARAIALPDLAERLDALLDLDASLAASARVDGSPPR